MTATRPYPPQQHRPISTPVVPPDFSHLSIQSSPSAFNAPQTSSFEPTLATGPAVSSSSYDYSIAFSSDAASSDGNVSMDESDFSIMTTSSHHNRYSYGSSAQQSSSFATYATEDANLGTGAPYHAVQEPYASTSSTATRGGLVEPSPPKTRSTRTSIGVNSLSSSTSAKRSKKRIAEPDDEDDDDDGGQDDGGEPGLKRKISQRTRNRLKQRAHVSHNVHACICIYMHM